MVSINFRDTLNKELKNPEFKLGYNELEDEFKAIEALIDARIATRTYPSTASLKMGVKQSAISRIGSVVLNIKYRTILSYLRAYGKA